MPDGRKKREFKGERREGEDDIFTFKLNPKGPPAEQEAHRILTGLLAEARLRNPTDRGAMRRIMTEAVLGLEGKKIPTAQETRSNLSSLTRQLDARISQLTELIDQMQAGATIGAKPTPRKKEKQAKNVSLSYLENLRQALHSSDGDEGEL